MSENKPTRILRHRRNPEVHVSVEPAAGLGTRSCDKIQSLRGTVFRTTVFWGEFMRIQMAYVGSSLSAYGFRLLTSIVRRKNPETTCSFVMFYNVRSIAKVISPVSETAELTDE